MNHKLKNERFRRRLVSILSCIVVFCTTYALILPAVTLERDDIVYYCGKEEHQHTDECYESPKDRPLCGLKEGEMVDGHVHDESCYKTEMVLDCLEDHEYTDECYKEEKTLVCDKEEGAQEHKHSSKCFLSTEPLCGKEVHTHSRECESNKGLKETKEDWEHSIPAKLKDTAAERMVQIALSQKDYKEVKENFELDEEGHEQYYTRYGEWYGRPYEDWNVMFVSFVLRYAGIKNEQIPYGHDWNEWIEDLTKKQLFADEGYLPKDGDLIFIKDKEDENVPDKEIRNYAGIVTDIENRKIVVGDLNGQVKEITLDDKEYETNAYVAMIESDAKDDVPADKEENDDNETNEEERPDEEAEEEVKEEETDPIEFRMPEQFEIENEDFTLTLTPRVFDEDVQEENQEQTEENSEETNEEGLKIKKFSLNEENIQDKIDAENELTKEELEQIAQANEEQKKEDEDKPLLTVQLEKIDEQAQTSEEEQAEIEQLKDQSLENVDQDNLLDLSFYKLRFFADGQEVDLKDQKFDAELTPTEQFVEKYDTTKDLEDVAPEANVGAELSIFQPTILNSDSSNLLNNISDKELNSEIYNSRNEISPISFRMNSSLFATSVDNQTNPIFTVQTWGKLKRPKEFKAGDGTTNEKAIVYDQSTITNGTNQKTYTIKNGSFLLEDNYQEIYKDQVNLEYHQHPELKYFNQLANNPDYTLKQIWILNDNGNPALDVNNKTIRNQNWKIIEYKDGIKFTNNEAVTDPNYVIIKNDTIIRLLYQPVSKTESFTSSANFYDYDITDDGKQTNGTYKSGTKPTAGTRETAHGINTYSNYSSRYRDMKKRYMLGFGNQNTGVGLKNQLNFSESYEQINAWGNAYFGIVTNLDSNGNLVYNNTIAAPALFEDGSAIGKYNYSGSLTFNQDGDTYTITKASVNGSTIGNLHQFTNLHKSNNSGPVGTHDPFWSNNFWPMDKINNKDPHTGKHPFIYSGNGQWATSTTYISTARIKSLAPAAQGTWNGPIQNYEYYYPASDDSIDHNNMFGMTYEIQFTLDEKYTGPLEYFFYGDDDLWVFLTDPDGKSTLIADLGGVHSTLGSHVDLREKHIKKDSQKSGTYKMKIFYTERGLSGSSCYLQFTLPNVTGSKTSQQTHSVSIQKETHDPDTTRPYEFKIDIANADGTSNRDRFDYAIVNINNPNATPTYGVITSGGTISLRKNEKATITQLPTGARVTATENTSSLENTKVYTWINGQEKKENNSNSSQSDGDVIYFLNVRSYSLPETGSLGIDPPLIAGSAGVMTTSFYALTLKRKGRWRKRKR